MKADHEVKDFCKLDKIIIGVLPSDGIGPIIDGLLICFFGVTALKQISLIPQEALADTVESTGAKQGKDFGETKRRRNDCDDV